MVVSAKPVCRSGQWRHGSSHDEPEWNRVDSASKRRRDASLVARRVDSRARFVCELFSVASGRVVSLVQHGRKSVAKSSDRRPEFFKCDVGVVAVLGNLGAWELDCGLANPDIFIGRSSSHGANGAESNLRAGHVDVLVVWARRARDCDYKCDGCSWSKLDHLQQCQYDYADTSRAGQLSWHGADGQDSERFSVLFFDQHCTVCRGRFDGDDCWGRRRQLGHTGGVGIVVVVVYELINEFHSKRGWHAPMHAQQGPRHRAQSAAGCAQTEKHLGTSMVAHSAEHDPRKM